MPYTVRSTAVSLRSPALTRGRGGSLYIHLIRLSFCLQYPLRFRACPDGSPPREMYAVSEKSYDIYQVVNDSASWSEGFFGYYHPAFPSTEPYNPTTSKEDCTKHQIDVRTAVVLIICVSFVAFGLGGVCNCVNIL